LSRYLLITRWLALVCTSVGADEASPASSVPEVVTDTHQRFDPGPGVWIAGEERGYETLIGAAAAAGVGLGYSWDLVGIQLEYLQSVDPVAGQQPRYVKLAAEYAFFTWGRVSAVGRTALTLMWDLGRTSSTPAQRRG
jgi:hypothetical protein